MPEVDGLEATKLIREFYSGLDCKKHLQPIIVGITGHIDPEFKAKAIAAGMTAVEAKPMYYSLLNQILKSYW